MTWWLHVVIGAATAAVGAAALAWPAATLEMVAVLFGVVLVMLGLARIVAGALTSVDPRAAVTGAALGALIAVTGAVIFLRPGESVSVVAVLFAAGLICNGVADLISSRNDSRPGVARQLRSVGAVVAIMAGLILGLFPGSSLLLLTRLSGAALIVVGAVQAAWGVANRPTPKADAGQR